MEHVNLRMGRISYINASPVYYGLDHGLAPSWLTLVTDVPAALNRQIMDGSVDLSPISAAHYAMNHTSLLLLPDLSISCHGPVMSVLCASNLPLDELAGKTVMLTKESATAASFMKMIFAQRGVTPRYVTKDVGNIDQIPSDVDAVLVIGDAALTQPWDQRFAFCFDLGQIWHAMTQMPFVFAVWAVRKEVAARHPNTVTRALELLWASRKSGYDHLDAVIAAGQAKLGLPASLIGTYYQHLFCDMDAPKIQAMTRFFDILYRNKILTSPVDVTFFQPE
ncbi:menaquinone biosynthetic enzyme MqnA/MqnD family protein [Desulfotignum balticum]|uniref:menaquinone biosynthetic enzyme MqnA/MqnD family protein n=1 Tax=Desulfotignum balticum TaxID=115781 RepID=UPI000462B278|nr:menaquinone biosynthesis protein [Desulfotignum balticum]